MASSKLVSVSTANSDLPRDSSICSLSTLIADVDKHNHSITMDDLLKNIYNDQPSASPPPPPSMDGGASASAVAPGRTVEEVWKEIVAGGGGGGADGEDEAAEGEADQVRAEMTLEDFLTRAGAVREEDVGVGPGAVVPIGYGQFQVQQPPPPQPQGQLVYANNNNGTTSGGGGRGTKRRAVQEAPLDKATQQKQRRMIKNRESAARSRERKQAYTVELESLVTQLEEENARLVREEAEQKKERYKKLMENLIPVVEKRRPARVLRRVQSMHW
ncbi:putative transcription factor bZIP family [Rosa chinensis]|uniref:Putative transcription factor bZIP family n=1 Tax=Rosa chinensis TaxID=74649 RepID=A0A2P6PDV6_ROSCH|nr:bZIP transcription factor 12 [Rosa chinensis]PRQ20099.1 putative transcription factor bZIP family [Rosa chinensis]